MLEFNETVGTGADQVEYSSTRHTISTTPAIKQFTLDDDNGYLKQGARVIISAADDPDCWMKGFITSKSGTSISVAILEISDVGGRFSLWEIRPLTGTDLSITSVADADYQVLASDKVVMLTSLTANRVWTLPDPAAVPAGYTIWFIDASGSLVDPSPKIQIHYGTGLINGAATAINLLYRYFSVPMTSNGVDSWAVNPLWYGQWNASFSFSSVVTFGSSIIVNNTMTAANVVSTGNATVGGTLGVTGAATFNAATFNSTVQINSTLGVTGLSSLGNTSITGTLGVSGLSTLAAVNATNVDASGTLDVDGLGTFNGNVDIAGSLDVDGVGTLNVTASGAASLLRVTEYNNGAANIYIRYSPGTAGSPSAAATAANLGSLGFQGDNGTTFATGAFIRALTTQSWTGARNPASVDIHTAANGGTSTSLTLSIQDGVGLTYKTNSPFVDDNGLLIAKTYTIATLPTPSVGAMAYVSDLGGGAGFVSYQAAGWIRTSNQVSTDNTDANRNVTYLTDAPTLRLAGFTASRNRDFQQTNAVAGAQFHIYNQSGQNAVIRDSGGPTTIKTLADNDWCTIEYRASQWRLIAYGAL